MAEAQTQAAIARAQQGQPVWAEAEVQGADATTTLAVEVDGVLVHQEAGWQEMKVVTLAPLGPDLHTDPQSGRTYLAWGAASYGVGTEEAEDFWWRVYVEALRRGLGTPAVRTVVVLGDGARWIWPRARAFLFLGRPGGDGGAIGDREHASPSLSRRCGRSATRSAARVTCGRRPGSHRSRSTSPRRAPPP